MKRRERSVPGRLRPLAISIQQPYVEQILRGTKVREFRKSLTRIERRVLLYASLKPAKDQDAWESVGVAPGELPVGRIVGSVRIAGCKKLGPKRFAYLLKEPRRLSRPWKPVNQPLPRFWYPQR